MDEMICEVCVQQGHQKNNEDCFDGAIHVLKQHYAYLKNALKQRDIELQQSKARNAKLNKALLLLQKNQQQNKRFKSYPEGISRNSSQYERDTSDLSLTDDESICVSKLNIALNSEQLFDTSALNQTKIDTSLISSEVIGSPRLKKSHTRNKQRKILLKDRSNKNLDELKPEWHTKGRNSSSKKCWAMKFLQPSASADSVGMERAETTDKRLCLSLKKSNRSKMKQSLININKSKNSSLRKSDNGEDTIYASNVLANKSSISARSWVHGSGNNYISNNSSTSTLEKATAKEDKTVYDIVFDFSPSKNSDRTTLELNSQKISPPKNLKFDKDISTDCTSLPKKHLVFPTYKSDSLSVVMLTPGTQDIIFIDDSCEEEIDTEELLADIKKQSNSDNLTKLKKYESTCTHKQQSMEIDLLNNPHTKAQNTTHIKPLHIIKQEKNTQDIKEGIKQQITKKEEQKSCSTKSIKTTKLPNSDDKKFDNNDNYMPKPSVIKQETTGFKLSKILSIKERFNIDCEDCEKVIEFLDKGLTDAQIQQHLDRCKRHNNPNYIMRQNTPEDFWNPFILSFQTDDPRNEVLIDKRFIDDKK